MERAQVRLTFVGDVMCEADQIIAHKVSDNDYNFNLVFNSFEDYFASSDYVVANLETPIAGEECGYSKEKWSFNSPIQFAEALKRSGVDLVSTANNHCLDRGIKGLKNTIKALDKCNLKHIGTYADKKQKKCFIEDIKGFKIAFLSYTYGTNAFSNNNYLGKDEKYMVNLFQEQELSNPFTRKCYNNPSKLYSKIYRKLGKIFYPKQFKKPVYERKESNWRCKRELIKEIRECQKNGADYIIMCMHAGGQYNGEPTEYTKQICDFLVKHGVNAVIGNHEHVVHKCDISRLSEGIIKTYSLGNFLGKAGVNKEPYDKMAEYSIVFNIYLSKNEDSILLDTCTFSIAKSIAYDGNKIKPVLLFDLINNCSNEDEKKKLISHNTIMVNTFLDTNFKSVELKKEYDIREILGY